MPVKPLRHRLQLAADLVLGKNIEYTGLDGAFLAHCRLRRWRVLLENQWFDPKSTRNRRALPPKNGDSSNNSNKLAFMDGH
jgi:hypothetical protein